MVLPAVELPEAISLRSDMHETPVTLRCTARDVYPPFTPIPLITHHTISSQLTMDNSDVHGFKHSWWRRGGCSRWSGTRRLAGVLIFLKTTDLPHKFFSVTSQRIISRPFKFLYIWKVDLVFSEKYKTVDNCNINELEEPSLPPSHTLT